jgi:hypothetical protein
MNHNYHPGAGQIGTFTPDNLLCGGFRGTPKSVQLKHGVNYVRGSILQESTTAGIFELVADDTKAVYVLMEDRDLSAATSAKAGVVHMTGEFNKSAVTIGAGATLAGVTKTLEKLNIYLRDSMPVIAVD